MNFLLRCAWRVACLLMLIVVLHADAQEAEPGVPRKIPSELPKVASSADGYVEVVASDVLGDPVGFRLPILQFATRHIRELERTYRLSLARHRRAGLIIYALEGRTNDTRVISRTQRRDDSLLTRIWLPSPGFSDLEHLKFEISKAYFGSWIDRTRSEGVTEAGTLPAWVVQGLQRATDSQTAHDDTRFVLELWSTARLPFFPALCTDLRVAQGRGAAMAGYLAVWMREKRIVLKLLEELASGQTWDGRHLAELLTNEKDPVLQDRISDERLARLTRAVLSPGRASAWDVKVFTSRLLLYPPEFDKNIGANRSSCSFREAVETAATNEVVRLAAWRKAREMPLCAIGRGEQIAAAAEAYRTFLLGVARGEGSDVLRPLLEKAEEELEIVRDENRKDDHR